MDSLQDMYINGSKDTQYYWDALKSLRNEESRPPLVDRLIPIGDWTTYFRSLFNPVRDSIPNNTSNPDPPIVTPSTALMEADITIEEVAHAVSKLKPGKAHYIDNLSTEILQYGHDSISSYMYALLKGCYATSIYPTQWARAYLVPIHKKGSPYDPLNYRGIAVGSSMGKILDLILLDRLEKFMDQEGLSHCFQSGFRKGIRTSDNLFAFLTMVDKQKSIGQPLYTCAIDFRKAYDSVDRDILLNKLTQAGLGKSFCDILRNKFQNLAYSIKSNGFVSVAFSTTIGLKQGDVLSPLLFNFYIYDLISHFNESCSPVTMGDLRVSSLQFADDVLVLAGTETGFLQALRCFDGFCEKMQLRINPAKTRIVVFGRGGGLPPGGRTWKLGGHDIEEMEELVYLGFMLRAGSLNSSLNQVMEGKATKAMYGLSKLSQGAPISLAKKLYSQLISPIHLYGAELWTAYVCPRAITNGLTETLNKSQNTLHCEKTRLAYFKYSVHMHRTTSNYGTMGEMGLQPLYIPAIRAMIKYYRRMCQPEAPTLVHQAWCEQKRLQSTNKPCWLTNVQKYLDQLSTYDIDVDSDSMASITGELSDRFIQWWNDQIPSQLQDGSKLRSYATYKTTFGMANYLDSTNIPVRNKVASFRLSNHKLRIEVDRHNHGVPIPPSQRICKMCTSGAVEDEIHLFQCSSYSIYRAELNIPAITSPDHFIQTMVDPSQDTQVYIFKALQLRERCKGIVPV